MKTIISKSLRLVASCVFACSLFLFTFKTFGIEGLNISVKSTNVILSWPSDSSETYIIQYRHTLDPGDSWLTLADYYPADSSTNITFFTDTNAVDFGPGYSSGGNEVILATSAVETLPPAPMVIRSNGSGGAVPLALYPPGFDLTGFLILDPATGETVNGAGYSIKASSPSSASANGLQAMDSGDGGGLSPTPMGGPVPDGGSNGAAQIPGTGFYRVVRDGVHVFNVNNFTNVVSNTIAIPFEVANDIGSIQDIVVLVDGARYRGADPIVPPGISGNITFDTAFLENGSHTVQIAASWLNPDGTDLNNLSITRYSDPFTLTVTNVIYYPNWEDEIGELGYAYYSFKTTCTNASWQIDIYDVSNSLAKTLSGYTADGFVETNWDLVDINGVTRATNDADGEFTAIITVGDPTTKTTPKKRKPFTYPSQGQWVIAYQDKFGSAVNSNSYASDIYDFGGIASPNGGAVSFFPTPGHPEYGQTFPMRYNYTNNPTPPTGLQIIADENALMTLLTNRINRNFYFNGHGNAESIATLESQRISIALQKHYYRFVFLDACSTANGSLPASFGINLSSTQPLTYFQAHGTRPRTFIGYTKDVIFAEVGDYVDGSGNHYVYHIPDRDLYFLSNFEFYWYFNYDLTTAIYNAQTDTPDLRYGWEDGADLNVFGYAALYINQYNHQTDWSN